MTMLYTIETRKSVEDVGKALEKAAQNHKFGVMIVHDMKEIMKKKGVEFSREMKIYEICNPQQAKKVLEEEPDISTALPCRVSVYAANGKTRLATIKPTIQLGMFGRKNLEPVAEEVEDAIIAIMNEAGK